VPPFAVKWPTVPSVAAKKADLQAL
jgi:hypothetical protein